MSAPTTRRDLILSLAAAPLTGLIIGVPDHRTGVDLTFVAQEWLRDAYGLGMLFLRSPDGDIWRADTLGDAPERATARAQHWVRLQQRPRLLRAVTVQAQAGFDPWEAGR